MKANTRYRKYVSLLKKKISRTVHSIRLDSFYGRVHGEKVFLTTIPKAGTNLIFQLLYNLPKYRIYTGRGLRPWMFDSENALIKRITKIKKGQILHGHVPKFPVLNEVIDNHNIKVIFMIRDPRDVLLSHMKYVTNIDKTHRTHTFFKDLKNDTAQIKALLYGEPGIVESIPTVYSRYSGWRDCQSAITIRFEDLVGKEGGGTDQDQKKSIKRILNHLHLDLNEKEIGKLAAKVFNKESDTFRSGKINQWKHHFEPSEIKLIKENLGQTLIEYGYEKDTNW